jgi:uncharacterized protein (TIGR00375 family)
LKYCADLHIHSPFSRGTSKALSLAELKKWALIKGINVLGSGDFTHPQWRALLKEHLIPDGRGFFALADDAVAAGEADIKVPEIPFRFCLSAEISSIYKKNGSTRKVHTLIFAPDLEKAERISIKLESIGNVKSDGRPILGLDPKNLLEIIKEISPDCHLIPAHIWTPWFSVFGAHSGFDSLEECFEDMLPHIFALETGLSSDPLMNWRVSALDRFTLVSNSDAHSAQKLMREANLFDTDLSYEALFGALVTREGFEGTIEFFPEEGKYHYDGHRKCNVVLSPEETLEASGLCPVCNKPLTVGVLHRVLKLADRSEGIKPASQKGFRYAIPLIEIISELLETGVTAKPVNALYKKAVEAAGNERDLLFQVPVEDIKKKTDEFLALAILRLREGKVSAKPGYDGEFGKISLFEEGELERLRGQGELFSFMAAEKKPSRISLELFAEETPPAAMPAEEKVDASELNAEQKKLLEMTKGAVMVLAGPGTGKTRTLTHWLRELIEKHGVEPRSICAITFTCKAKGELSSRLAAALGEKAMAVTITTFHALAWEIIIAWYPEVKSIYDEAGRRALLSFLYPGLSATEADDLSRRIEAYLDGTARSTDAELETIAREYQEALHNIRGVDVASLIAEVNLIFQERPEILEVYRRRFQAIAVDEFQDINLAQYRFLSHLIGIHPREQGKRLLKNKSILVIGDPDQAIYGFRGGDPALFFRFQNEYQAGYASLSANYRSSGAIVGAAAGLIGHNSLKSGLALSAQHLFGTKVSAVGLRDEAEEGEYVAGLIKSLVGGIDLISEYPLAHDAERPYSFQDIAVLGRTHRVVEGVAHTCVKHNIPVALRADRALLGEPRYALLVDYKNIVNRFIPGLGREALAALLLSFKKAKGEIAVIAGDPEAVVLLSGRERKGIEVLLHFLEFIETEIEAQGVAKGLFLLLEKLHENETPSVEMRLADQALVEMARGYGNNLALFIREIFLSPREASFGYPVERVSFLTFHAAKGLEFPVVFIAAAEEGITPQTRTTSELDEERRLFYVAMTRAGKRLFISFAHRRASFGKETEQKPSRFIAEIPADFIQTAQPEKKKTVFTQPGLF